MDINKILEGSLDEIADNIFNETKNTTDKAKAIQKQRIGENVQYVIDALKKIEADLRGDLRDEYRDVANKLSERITSIKNGQDGRNGADGRAGKDGRAGRDGLAGSKGADGLPGRDGIDGVDGVSVTDASIDFDGSLIISLSNGRVINVGEVVSQDLADKIQVISTMSTNGAVGIQDEGTSISTGVKNINFVGASVTSTASGDNVTVNIGAAGTGVFDAGTALLPSITTTGDLNTGVYFPAADTVGITTGGAQRGAFSSTGLAVTGTISSSTGFSSFAAITASLGSDGISVGTSTGASARGNVIYRGTDASSVARVGYVGINVYGTDGSFEIKHGSSAAGITISTAGLVTAGAGLAVTGTLSTTGVATFAAGTVALPSITTSGDTNTGVYFPAADTVGITAGGTERMRINSSGDAIFGANSWLTLADSGSGNGNIKITATGSNDFGGSFLFRNLAGTSEYMRIDSSGNVLVGKASATANGGDVQVSKGITFPATQVAASDVNTLDDYEEGTWTPSQGSNLTIVGTFSSAGTYTKIGRLVTVRGTLTGSTSAAFSGGSPAILCANLPFTVVGTCVGGAVDNGFNQGISCASSGTSVYGSSAITATAQITFSATYFV